MKRITDKDFKYVPASKTDIRKTFARARKELREQEKSKIVQLPKREGSEGR